MTLEQMVEHLQDRDFYIIETDKGFAKWDPDQNGWYNISPAEVEALYLETVKAG